MIKIFKYSFFGAVLLLQSLCGDALADKLAHLRSAKKIVAVHEISAPYFAIQILALKRPPQNPSFFKNIDKAKEYVCADGYVRYTVGEFESKEEARQNISIVKSMGYTECFVVDIRGYNLARGASSTVSSGYEPDENTDYTVQIAAFRYPVYTSEFEEFDDVMEFYLDDRIYRYTVGRYSGAEAKRALERIKSMGYPQAHLVPYEKYKPYRIE
ncbi:SPOR domain-containing protein [Anaerophaga thermohalophila]|uniref:SPOR domain-containing protein n=1 Tax=Anaerophaga thermohalophila TaxID=177400 RepID=UPI000237C470|nr:SPOR domain-containing protein [Anaerophaga thermohalophila]